jgi:hypothetical protein
MCEYSISEPDGCLYGCCSHDELTGTLAGQGQPFTERYNDQTTEMKRSLLEYMKSLRVKADALHAGAANNTVDQIEMKMTVDGYPILPDIVMEGGLTKKKCEIMLRTYLSQHHCECRPLDQRFFVSTNRNRSCKWQKVPTCAICCFERRYGGLHSTTVSSCKPHG